VIRNKKYIENNERGNMENTQEEYLDSTTGTTV
jgi:hypothetical protein